MRRGGSLAARLAKLEEAARRADRCFPRLAFMVHPADAPEATVEGFRRADGITVARKAGEALNELVARSCEGLRSGLALFACYPPDPEPAEPAAIVQDDPDGECDPWETPAPEPAIFDRSQHWSEFRKSQEW